MSTYKQKLLDPRWQRRRLEVLNRDDWQCQVCGARDNTLHVHHAAYNPSAVDPWGTCSELLFAVCADCHDGAHASGKDAVFDLQEIFACASIRTPNDLVDFTEWVRQRIFQTKICNGGSASPEDWVATIRDVLEVWLEARATAKTSGDWWLQ